MARTEEDLARSEQRQLNRQRNIRHTILVCVVLVLFVSDALAFALQAHASAAAPHGSVIPAWRIVLQFTLGVAGLAGAIASLVLFVRSNASRPRVQVLTRQARKQLLMQYRGRQPLVPAQLPAAQDLARSMAYRPANALVGQLAMALVLGGQAAGRYNPWIVVIDELAVLILAVAVVLTARAVRQARRFLDQHPAGSELPLA